MTQQDLTFVVFLVSVLVCVFCGLYVCVCVFCGLCVCVHVRSQAPSSSGHPAQHTEREREREREREDLLTRERADEGGWVRRERERVSERSFIDNQELTAGR